MQTKNESEAAASTHARLPASEVVLGTVTAIDNSGRPLVSFKVADYAAESQVALSTQPLRIQDVGRQVALLFAAGDPNHPIIMGLIHSPLDALLQPGGDEPSLQTTLPVTQTPTETRIDGKRLVFEAEEEVVIKCGESSIVLNKNGKVSIRGKYLLSRSSGVNRILGGSVQVN